MRNHQVSVATSSLRYLFGPVTGAFAEQNLKRFRESGTCLAFNSIGDLDLTIRPWDSWEQICRGFPPGWQPDFLVLNPAYATLPAALLSVPLPRVALATDWNLLWHWYRVCLPCFDLVLTDAAGVEALGREGIAAQVGRLDGCERAFAEMPSWTGRREIDVLFVGNLNPSVLRERASRLAALSRLGRRWRVRIRGAVFGEEYRSLLQRSRIVVEFSAQHRAGRPAVEAALAGALVFQEAGNPETPGSFRDRVECVHYRPDNLEELVSYYLENEEERQALAEAARERARGWSFEELWQEQIEALTRGWSELRDRAGRPSLTDRFQGLAGRCWQALSSGKSEDAALASDLQTALKENPDSAPLANLMGCLLWRQGQGRNPAGVQGNVVASLFRRALDKEPGFALAGLNLAETLEAAGRRTEALEAAQRTLDVLARSPELDQASVEGMPLCQPFESLHVEWDRAAWRAGSVSDRSRAEIEARSKRDLILWRLHGLLGGWTSELPHFHEACLQRPDLPGGRASLGAALARAGRPREAVEHLRRAVADNPLDRESARGCFHLLGQLKDNEGRQRLCEDQRLLARSAPQVIPLEPWFAPARPKGNELVSIVLLCPEQSPHVSGCLERLLRNSRPPFELILVVPGGRNAGAVSHPSQKGAVVDPDKSPAAPAPTPFCEGWLTKARKHVPAPARIELVRCRPGAGRASAFNQGIGRARGSFVVLLHGETAVAPGFLEGLVVAALQEGPAAAIVAPLTNDPLGPQGIEPRRDPSEELDRFAARCRRAHPGQTIAVNRLNGTCLLVQREVIEHLGGLDERFTTELFAADLCLRAQEAGQRLLIARDTYVHDFSRGGQDNLAVAAAEQSASDDLAAFQDKWGREISTSYLPRPQSAEPSAEAAGASEDAAPPKPHIVVHDEEKKGNSLCMIVRNEEQNLPACLRSVAGLFDDVVVADTGSTDATREAARQAGARVVEFPWVDSFAAARNESVRCATGKWITWLDADDRLDDENRERLRQVLASLGDERDAYAVQVRSVLDERRSAFRMLDQVRIFRNLPQNRWDYRIHEQILPSVNRDGGRARFTNVIIDHVGYQDASVRGASSSGTCACWKWTIRRGRRTPSACSTWAGPCSTWSGRPRRCRTCKRAWPTPSQTLPSCASCIT